mmetsp:Transcript_15830/g.40249  ORF Transcript_15830/g.40249 Transcript_15830/m.40249 type:complete len:226 (+) Transcript_15830:75-752(+)
MHESPSSPWMLAPQDCQPIFGDRVPSASIGSPTPEHITPSPWPTNLLSPPPPPECVRGKSISTGSGGHPGCAEPCKHNGELKEGCKDDDVCAFVPECRWATSCQHDWGAGVSQSPVLGSAPQHVMALPGSRSLASPTPDLLAGKNGEVVISVGSVGHPSRCGGPCKYYSKSNAGCKDRDACKFCHLCRWTKMHKKKALGSPMYIVSNLRLDEDWESRDAQQPEVL